MEPLDTLPFAIFSLAGLVGIYHKKWAGPALAAVGSTAWTVYAFGRGEYPWALVESVFAIGSGLTAIRWYRS